MKKNGAKENFRSAKSVKLLLEIEYVYPAVEHFAFTGNVLCAL